MAKRKKNKKRRSKFRLLIAKTLSEPRFRPKVANTDKKRKDPKKSRRKWKNRGVSE